MAKVYTTTQLCEILQLSAPTVRKLIKEGRLKSLNTGKKILVSEDELKRFLNKK